MTKVWFITGSSRGLGRSLTEAVLAKGDSVAATARNPEQLKDLAGKYPQQLLTLALDVTDYAAIPDTVAQVVNHFGKIDVLVNNAGFGITGATEAFTEDQVRSQLETNLHGPIAITRAVLPYMRKQGSGRILQVSSVGGRVGNAGLTVYQAAKFGLSGFSEALAKEVSPLNIFVTSVEPGGFRTDWAGDSMSFAPHVEGYESTVDQVIGFLKSGNLVPMGDPDKAAQAIITLSNDAKPPIHLLLGSEAVALVKASTLTRQAELEKWEALSRSTDHDDAENFMENDDAKIFISNQ